MRRAERGIGDPVELDLHLRDHGNHAVKSADLAGHGQVHGRQAKAESAARGITDDDPGGVELAATVHQPVDPGGRGYRGAPLNIPDPM